MLCRSYCINESEQKRIQHWLMFRTDQQSAGSAFDPPMHNENIHNPSLHPQKFHKNILCGIRFGSGFWSKTANNVQYSSYVDLCAYWQTNYNHVCM